MDRGSILDPGPLTFDPRPLTMMIMMTTEMMMMTFENILTQELFTLLIGILVSPGELSSSSWEGFLNVNVISSCSRTSPSSLLLATPSPLPSPKSSLPSSDHFSQVDQIFSARFAFNSVIIAMYYQQKGLYDVLVINFPIVLLIPNIDH